MFAPDGPKNAARKINREDASVEHSKEVSASVSILHTDDDTKNGRKYDFTHVELTARKAYDNERELCTIACETGKTTSLFL